MPAAKTKRKERRAAPPVDGNLAYRELERKLEKSGRVDFDQQYHRRVETKADRISRRRQKAKSMVRPAQHVSGVMVVAVGVVSVLMVVLIICYAQLNTISVNIVDMKEEIEALEIENVRLLAEYEQAFDLASVNEKARDAGMSPPSDSQIYYIDLPGEDQAVACADDGNQSILSRFLQGIRSRLDEILAYFR